jgi:hypothetical protein
MYDALHDHALVRAEPQKLQRIQILLQNDAYAVDPVSTPRQPEGQRVWRTDEVARARHHAEAPMSAQLLQDGFGHRVGHQFCAPAGNDVNACGPGPSKIPDGKTASKAEMVTAMQTLKEYTGDVETYLKCLEFERKQKD